MSEKHKCKGHNKDGSPCKNSPVTGWTVCRMHGKGGGRPVVHGKYSKKVPRWLTGSYKHHIESKDLTGQHDKLALLNSLIDQRLGELGEVENAELWRAAINHFGQLKEALKKEDTEESDKALKSLGDILLNGLGQSQKESDLRRLIQEAGDIADIEIRRQKSLKVLNEEEGNALLALVYDVVKTTFRDQPSKVIGFAAELRSRMDRQAS